MKLAQLGIALALAASLWTPVMAADATVTAEAASLHGTAGVCVRWGDDPEHVAAAVVVESSGNPQLDQVIAASVKSMKWSSPGGKYAGEWVGVSLSVDGSPPIASLPNCTLLDATGTTGGTAS